MNENLTFIHDFVHFMKWIAKYIWICPFHEMDSRVVHFMKWTICLSISRNGQFHIWVITYTCTISNQLLLEMVKLTIRRKTIPYCAAKKRKTTAKEELLEKK